MPPEMILILIVACGVVLYALLGGADFGAGVWLVNTRFQASERETQLLYSAIGPVWEANHVWLIFVMIAVWNGFPMAFGDLCRILWLPLFLALLGIVFRGAAYAFRTHMPSSDQSHVWWWERVFAVASVATPFCFGMCVGVLASGFDHPLLEGSSSWLNAVPWFCGFFAVGLCAFLSSLYLYREAAWTGNEQLVAAWRRRALLMGVLLGAFAVIGLGVVYWTTPEFAGRLFASGGFLVGLSLASGIFAVVQTYRSARLTAMIGGAVAVTTVLGGWVLAMSPDLVPGRWTIETAKAPDSVIWLMLGVVALGAVLLVPALGLLFWIYKRGQTSSPSSTGQISH